MLLTDSLEITDKKMTPEGHMVVRARISRIGVHDYFAIEIGKALPPRFAGLPRDSIVKLHRPAAEVFSESSLATLLGSPVTDGHPSEFVTDANESRYLKGKLFGVPVVDGDFVTAKLLITDKSQIEKINSGVRQVSLGYNLDIDWTEGVDERFGIFDGVQKNIRVNHVAIVAAGRAGPRVRITDQKKDETTMAVKLIDGVSVEFSEQGAQVVDKLQSAVTALETELENAKTEIKDTSAKLEESRGSIAAKDARIEELENVDINALVAARMSLVDSARKLSAGLDPAGKSDQEIKVEAIKALDENFDLEDKSDDYVHGVFAAFLKVPKSKTSAMDETLKQSAATSGSVTDARTAGKAKLKARSAVKVWDKE